MPPFDPVRDAVLNSPVEPHNPSLVSPLASPSLTRRATDLSVLLNSEPQPLPATTATSSSSRGSSFSHHAVEDNKLASSEPLARRYASSRSASSSQHPPYPSPGQESTPSPTVYSNSSQHFDYQRPSSSSSGSAAHKQSGGPSGHGRHAGTLSPSMPPPPSRSSSVTAPSEMDVSMSRHSSSTFASSSIPYRPTKRITPAGSVTVPLSQQEIETFKTFQGQGAIRLAAKRKRSGSDDGSERPTKVVLGDVGVVIEHYNSRPDVGVVQRQESPIIGLKSFNNWVKSVLITRFAHPVLQKSSVSGGYGQGRRGGGRGKVLDMGCGKGGDITKWSKARIKELLCVDIAAVSVEQARSRYQSMDSSRFEASFAALDCYTEPLAKAFSPAKLSTQFDVVSMQFCMHYAFETLEKTRIMLDNVSRYLRPGGVFIGTIPNAELLMQELDALPPDTDDLTFGNNVYKIRFEQRQPRPLFGHKYWFFLQDAVEDVPEYVVHWDNFVELAADYGLYPIYKEEFHQVFDEHQSKDEFRQLMVRMKVINSEGESSMSEDEWEAANIYIAFALEKR